MRSIEKLASISSAQLSRSQSVVDFTDADGLGSLGRQIKALLRARNGFYAFESALHVFPAGPAGGTELTLRQWNSPNLWRFEYGELVEGAFFFAEDAFGNQFCAREDCIYSFEAETGELNVLADDLEEWARRVLKEYDMLTGYPLLRQWQEKNGALPAGMRLMPKIPFVLGGEYSLANLYPLGAVSAMRSRGNLARQIKDLPDGTQVEFHIIE